MFAQPFKYSVQNGWPLSDCLRLSPIRPLENPNGYVSWGLAKIPWKRLCVGCMRRLHGRREAFTLIARSSSGHQSSQRFCLSSRVPTKCFAGERSWLSLEYLSLRIVTQQSNNVHCDRVRKGYTCPASVASGGVRCWYDGTSFLEHHTRIKTHSRPHCNSLRSRSATFS